MIKGYKPILFKFHIVIILLLFMLAHSAITDAKSNKLHFPIHNKSIVIDPGHGGYDNGARGPDGTFEKTVTMELALVLAAELEKTYKVILTRTDDYWIDILKRTSMANHLNADMFISIHTGGSFLHQTNGISLYYYEKISSTTLMLDADSIEGFKGINSQPSWSDIQNRHLKTSKVLAELIRNRMNEQLGEQAKYKTDIQGAPLMVLEGADTPTVLIEVGYITNPSEEKSFKDINVLSDIAKRIKSGIDDFFKNTP
jgi:N-acetylmuramoyl-L-alanine amidase